MGVFILISYMLMLIKTAIRNSEKPFSCKNLTEVVTRNRVGQIKMILVVDPKQYA